MSGERKKGDESSADGCGSTADRGFFTTTDQEGNEVDIAADPWNEVLGAWRKHGDVDKAQIIRLLESDYQVPVAANEIIAGLLNRSIKARRGNKKNYKISGVTAYTIVSMVFDIEAYIKNPDQVPKEIDDQTQRHLSALRQKARRKRRDDRDSPRELAKKEAGALYGITTRHVQTLIDAENKKTIELAQMLAERHGIPAADLVPYLQKQRFGYSNSDNS